MQGDRGVRLEKLVVEGGKDAHHVVAASRAAHNARSACGDGGSERTQNAGRTVNRLEKLSNNKRHRLDALHFLGSADQLARLCVCSWGMR